MNGWWRNTCNESSDANRINFQIGNWWLWMQHFVVISLFFKHTALQWQRWDTASCISLLPSLPFNFSFLNFKIFTYNIMKQIYHGWLILVILDLVFVLRFRLELKRKKKKNVFRKRNFTVEKIGIFQYKD